MTEERRELDLIARVVLGFKIPVTVAEGVGLGFGVRGGGGGRLLRGCRTTCSKRFFLRGPSGHS